MLKLIFEKYNVIINADLVKILADNNYNLAVDYIQMMVDIYREKYGRLISAEWI